MGTFVLSVKDWLRLATPGRPLGARANSLCDGQVGPAPSYNAAAVLDRQRSMPTASSRARSCETSTRAGKPRVMPRATPALEIRWSSLVRTRKFAPDATRAPGRAAASLGRIATCSGAPPAGKRKTPEGLGAGEESASTGRSRARARARDPAWGRSRRPRRHGPGAQIHRRPRAAEQGLEQSCLPAPLDRRARRLPPLEREVEAREELRGSRLDAKA